MRLSNEAATMPTPRLALITIAATLVYIGLAVLGWGGFAAFFAHPALVGLTITVLALTGAALFSGANLSAGEREDSRNRWIFVPLTLLGLLGAYTDRRDLWTLDGDAVRWLGLSLCIAGGVLRVRATFLLGRRFSGLVAIQPGHSLVTTGLYGVLRHPSYLGLLVSSLGWGLTFRSAVGVLLTFLTIPPILARIQAEDALLLKHFGAEYDAYRARTARLIPGLY
jgi:protein-S-isoprenylcysteine O-methyltransferase Ste14